MSHLQLNNSQATTLTRIFDFLNDQQSNTFILKGYAGTGKTFLMQHLATQLQEKNQPFCFLATTGRAATVLKGKTNLNAQTIHSELYNFSEVDGDSEQIPLNAGVDAFGQMKLIFNLRSRDEKEKVYIIDEASMLSTDVIVDKSYAEFGSGNLLKDLLYAVGNNKIIFVGDPCQLPPVGQSFSPALDENWMQTDKRAFISVELTEIVRTKADNDVLILAHEVRNLIGSTELPKWPKFPAVGRTNCLIHASERALLDHYLQRFNAENAYNIIAIAQSNSLCHKINTAVRNQLWGKQNSDLQIGDVLLVTQNNYLVPLTNGDFVKVVAIGPSQHEANLHFKSVRIKNITTEKEYEILLAMDVLIGIHANLTQEQQRSLMISFSNKMRKKNIPANSDAYKERMKEDPYLNSLRATYGYAITCHKAQGGEWDEVFLFLQKSMYGMPRNDMFRWWYTAITRTKERLHVGYDWWVG